MFYYHYRYNEEEEEETTRCDRMAPMLDCDLVVFQVVGAWHETFHTTDFEILDGVSYNY